MKILDIIWYSWKGIKEIGVRAIITIIGIILAMFFLSFAISVGLGFKELLIKSLSSFLGANYVYVIPKKEILTLSDIYTLKVVPHVIKVIPLITATGYLYLEGRKIGTHIVGIDPKDIPSVIKPESVIMGTRDIKGSRTGLIGHFVAFDRAKGRYRVKNGSLITINVYGKTLNIRIVGILDPHTGIGPVWFGGSVIIPYYELLNLLPSTRKGYTISVLIIDKPDHVDEVINFIKKNIPHLRATSFKEALSRVLQFSNQITIFLAFLSSAASIIVALWMYDTATISILQRIKEIGILKAIGFKNRDILTIFLTEVILITIIGISIGLILLILIVSNITLPIGGLNIKPVLNFESLVMPISVIMFANIMASLPPIVKAFKMTAASALRYE